MNAFIAAKYSEEQHMDTSVEITFSVSGIHNWPEAPDEIAFLRFPHCHLFIYTVEVEVSHNDRDIEFFLLRQELEEWISETYEQSGLDKVYFFGRQSCESLAAAMCKYIIARYPGRAGSVKVSEDGIFGATVAFDSKKGS